VINLKHCAEFFERVLKAITRAKKDLGLWPTILISMSLLLVLIWFGWETSHLAIEIIHLIDRIATAILCLIICGLLVRYAIVKRHLYLCAWTPAL